MHSTSEQIASTAETLVECRGSLGRIRLNRPKALNSLTLNMVRDIDSALEAFAHDPAINAVLVTGEGERGFCAGGDIRAIHEGGRAGSPLPKAFWREEYQLNARINRYPKPYIVFMDGIVMGGGVGLSVYGSHRIVTERTRLAMPETGIGFFPDVGASWFLTRGDNELGTYLALTGDPIGAADTIELGLADTCVASDRLSSLIDALAALPPGSNRKQISETVQTFAKSPPDATLAPHQPVIDRIFAARTIGEIVAGLQREASPFADTAASALASKSPLSLHVTLKLLRLGRQSATLEECLEREFAATAAVLNSHDFYEGVRAAVIDKDRNPQWRPASPTAVTEADVAAYFSPSSQPLFVFDQEGSAG
ncbi:MAG: 3-hydroxyisobutyryl-CoA hydrolase [Rhizobium sp.]|nr:3-hydroxyisobutyryl-CoA hydrolase [Rhizobium sp.]